MTHTATLVAELTVLVLAIFLGFEVISKVPTMLHTPLMSGTNAIHGIVIVGAMIVAGSAHPDGLTQVIGFVAMVLAAANVVGGFVVTDRMLEMFKKREPPKGRRRLDGAGEVAEVAGWPAPGPGPPQSWARTASTCSTWSRSCASCSRFASSRLRRLRGGGTRSARSAW
jgi:NAD(P) transhydrogenase subunit alpha